jgi:2-keto-4-pentenoate hydratase
MDKDMKLERPTTTDMIKAIAYASPAIAICGSRIGKWDCAMPFSHTPRWRRGSALSCRMWRLVWSE